MVGEKSGRGPRGVAAAIRGAVVLGAAASAAVGSVAPSAASASALATVGSVATSAASASGLAAVERVAPSAASASGLAAVERVAPSAESASALAAVGNVAPSAASASGLATVGNVATSAESATTEVRRGPFIIRADFDLTPLEGELRELDSLLAEITRTFRLPKLRENVVVRIFRDETTWRAYWNREFGSAPYRRALYDRKNYLFDRDGANGRVYLCVNPLFAKDLRHECSHAVLAAALGRSVPIWLDEGIAEYFEEPAPSRLTNETWRPRTVERLRRGEFSSLESLEKLTEMTEMTPAKYCDSWAWVCWFLNGPEPVRDALPRYLNDLASRKPFAAKPSKRLKAIAKDGAAERSLRRFYGVAQPTAR